MKLFVLLLLSCSFSALSQDSIPPSPKVIKPPAKPLLFDAFHQGCSCGIEASFPGGDRALKEYIASHLRLSVSKSQTIYVEFLVNDAGEIEQVIFLRSDYDPVIIKDIENFLYHMPTWIPGEYKCESVATRIRLPITITIGDDRYYGG